MVKWVLQSVRDASAAFFHRFGIHCATHQIRLILISGLVITSLFYPALAIYSSSNAKPLAHFSSHILDSFLDPQARLHQRFEDDVHKLWSGHDALRIRDDSVARCGMDRTVRVERLLVQSTILDDAGAINPQTLQSTLKIETQLTDLLSPRGNSPSYKSPCISYPNEQCIVLSPLEYWSHDAHGIATDPDVVSTINSRKNVSAAGIPLTLPMVLAGRETSKHSGQPVDFARFLAITYLFLEEDCLSPAGHNQWIRALDQAASQVADISLKSKEPKLLALEFDPELRNTSRFSIITLFLYISYIVFFVFFSGSMRRMETVHSRVGLCFTGLVEILCSTITSLSVCAIGGFRITMVPWSILPIVLVFVGAENMFRLIDEVVKTPITLPVKERIGVGLSRAGTSNTLKVFSYNAILGTIAFFATGAIRQFCVFAIVVLVAHWFLIHTFFVAVLSIDIQRLELDDLLRQDSSLAPSANGDQKVDDKSSKPRTASGVVLSSLKNLLKGRITKNVSLLLLLAVTGTLYYASQPSAVRPKEVPLTRASVLRSKAESAKVDIHSQAWQIWKVLNPEEDALLHLRIEAPAIVTLHPETKNTRPRPRSRFSLRSLRPLLWLTKIIVLPIGSTLGALYALCLYLLKDADLLEAQRNKAGPGEDEVSSQPIEGKVLFTTLPRTFATDLAMLSASEDGGTLLCVSLDGEVKVWVSEAQAYVDVDTNDLLLRSASSSSALSSVTAVAVDDSGKYFAVGSGSGVIGVWEIQSMGIKSLPHLYLDASSFAVTDIHFTPNPSIAESVDRDETKMPSIVAAYDNGTITQWTFGSSFTVTGRQIASTRPSFVTKAHVIRYSSTAPPLAAFFLVDGCVEVTEIPGSSALAPECILQVGNPSDCAAQFHACMVDVDSSPRVILAAATQAGVISLWDGTTMECISVLEEVHGRVSRLRVFAIPPKACTQCGELPMGSFVLSFSVAHVVVVNRAFLTRRCSCPLNQPLVSKSTIARESIGRRSRSGSFVSSSGGDSPLRPRLRLPSLSSDVPPFDLAASFPVSGHGGHARRISDKDFGRRFSEKGDRLPVPFDEGEPDYGARAAVGPPDGLRVAVAATEAGGRNTASVWRNFRLVRAGDATCERGGWGVIGNRVVGLRRLSRLRESPAAKGHDKLLPARKHRTASACGSLSWSVLDRWEVWILDPCKGDGRLQTSSLSRLQGSQSNGSASDNALAPRLPFTRLSSVLMTNSCCLAGFGNTTGVIDFGAS